MRVLVVNTGSSSAKLSVLDQPGAPPVGGDRDSGAGHGRHDADDGHEDELIGERTIDPWDGGADELIDAVGELAERCEPIDAVGHRVVHGGDRFDGPARLDQDVVRAVADLAPLAPLHQPRALAGIEAADRALPGVPAVACFDTAFHAHLPAAAATYALPRAWRQRWDLRRRGFHGLSHAWAARRAARIAGVPLDRARTVTCHLGGGASLCAVAGGRSVDTTMGMTPLEGVVMTTRSGSVDPGLLLWLLEDGRLGRDELAEGLQRHGGLAGLAGSVGERAGGDLRAILPAAAAGDAEAALAVEVYLHRLRAAVAAMAASAGGLDVLAFTGGAGQHQPVIRAGVADRLGFLGVGVDPAANDAAHGDADVSVDGAAVRTVVVALGEDAEIVRQVRATLS